MYMREVDHHLFESAFNDVKDTMPFKEFVGYRESGYIDCKCYLNEDACGFAISPEKELTTVFNVKSTKIPDDPLNIRMLEDPEVKDIILSEADWLVCICYVDYNFGTERARRNYHLVDYYNKVLGFNYYGEADSGTIEDIIERKGLDFAARFIKNYGIPYQVFMVNPKYNFDQTPTPGLNYNQVKQMLLTDLKVAGVKK